MRCPKSPEGSPKLFVQPHPLCNGGPKRVANAYVYPLCLGYNAAPVSIRFIPAKRHSPWIQRRRHNGISYPGPVSKDRRRRHSL